MYSKIMKILASDEFRAWYKDFELYYVQAEEWSKLRTLWEVRKIFQPIFTNKTK